jgi:hypothetical protein
MDRVTSLAPLARLRRLQSKRPDRESPGVLRFRACCSFQAGSLGGWGAREGGTSRVSGKNASSAQPGWSPGTP